VGLAPTARAAAARPQARRCAARAVRPVIAY
jgi:hypothetical protein